jgi:hypothetical protein
VVFGGTVVVGVTVVGVVVPSPVVIHEPPREPSPHEARANASTTTRGRGRAMWTDDTVDRVVQVRG